MYEKYRHGKKVIYGISQNKYTLYLLSVLEIAQTIINTLHCTNAADSNYIFIFQYFTVRGAECNFVSIVHLRLCCVRNIIIFGFTHTDRVLMRILFCFADVLRAAQAAGAPALSLGSEMTFIFAARGRARHIYTDGRAYNKSRNAYK